MRPRSPFGVPDKTGFLSSAKRRLLHQTKANTFSTPE